ncbi:MAG: hypothetical protein WCK74_07895 [Gemmatimonadaceae bacterium]
MTALFRPRLVVLASLLALAPGVRVPLLTATLQAQQPAAAPAPRTVDGRVRRPSRTGGDSTGMAGVANVWVTLHRVGKAAAGPIDSVRSDAAGRYHLSYRLSGEADAVYFASVSWNGIAYFTAPLKSVAARGDEAEITVFDTTSQMHPLTVKGRHLIIGSVDSTAKRTVIEVFELSNDSLKTLVTREGAAPTPTWSVAIPQAATDVRVTEGDISADAFTSQPGRVSVFAPIAPGLKQIAFSYRMAAESFPVQLAAEHGATVFEILLEEPKGSVFGTGFANVDPVTLENRNFRRFLAQDVRDATPVTVELPTPSASGRNLYIAGLLSAIGCLMIVVLFRQGQRRAAAQRAAATTVPGFGRQALPPEPVPDRDRLAREIALLDATYARQDNPSASVTAAYEARRQELRDALAEALK